MTDLISRGALAATVDTKVGWPFGDRLTRNAILAIIADAPPALRSDVDHEAERAALDAGTHESAVDDFGNQYLAPKNAPPALTVERMAAALRKEPPGDPTTPEEVAAAILAALAEESKPMSAPLLPATKAGQTEPGALA